MKERAIFKVSNFLMEKGFEVAECCGIHSAFDIIAKKGQQILLVKILSNIEALNPKTVNDLKRVSNVVSGIPIVIGDHMKGKKLMNGVIYSRYDIRAMNFQTFKNVITGELPNVHAIRGNYCVKINPDVLAELRKKFDMTQDELAHELGISKQSIYRYESSGNVSREIAEKVIKIFGKNLLNPEDVLGFQKFQYEERRVSAAQDSIPKLKRIVISELQNLGFKISVTNAPFDLVALEVPKREKIFTLVSNDPTGLKRKAEVITKISSMLHSYKVCISEKEQDIDILVIKPKDLSEITKARELLKLLEEENETE